MLDEIEIEHLQELLSSEGWHLLWSKVLPPRIAQSVNEGMNCVRKQDAAGAAESIAKVDGAVQVAVEAYKAAKEKIPDSIMQMRRA